MTRIVREIRIQNLKGLHARATAAFVKTAEKFKSRVAVEKTGEMSVSGKSIMGLLMLAVPLGGAITITADGPDAEKAMKALVDLVEDKFGEGE
ncbi:MAG: HPr family phosphocarrier protein [Alphaproteobacteria bacterium]|nr:HPr family phosphocarrier protein [Alphaproteobacteria bacterium]